MKTTMICVAMVLAAGFLAATAIADQSCRFVLNDKSSIGSAEFQAGEYKLVVDGPKVVLTELKTGKTVELEAKIENLDKKSDGTEVRTKQVGGVKHVSEIRMGGSKTKLTFD